MKNFLLGMILALSTAVIADDNILITDVSIRAGDQVIVYVDDIGQYEAIEDDVKIVLDAEDVLPGRHEIFVRVVDGDLKIVKETKKVINDE